jgi:Sec-independent protein translocase protein TatA
MFNLDPAKLLVIGIVAIILLGPDKLPKVAKQAGAAWRSFNEFRHRMESEVRNTVPDLPPTSEIARLARSPSALLHHLSTMSDDDEDEAPDGSFQPPGGAGGAAPEGERAPASASTSDSAEGVGSPADGAGSPTEGAGAPANGAEPPATNGAGTAPTASPAAGPAPPISRAPSTSAGPVPEPEVIVPGDPSLN